MEKNSEKIRFCAKRRWAENKEAMSAYNKRYMKLNPEKMRLYNSRRDRFMSALSRSRSQSKFKGYTPCTATIKEIAVAFTGFCQNPGCGVPESECTRKLALDHDHKTGKFRGWLCGRCNSALGLLKDSTDTIFGLAVYVEQSDSNDLCTHERANG